MAEVEVPLVIVGATPAVAACSRGNVAMFGVGRELLRSRLVGYGLAQGSVLLIEVGELTPRGEGAVLAGVTMGGGSTRLFFAKVASGERAISRDDDILWGEGGFLGVARANGIRVESFLVGSPACAGDTGAPVGEGGSVWVSFCVGNFTNADAGRLLGFSEAGREGGTGIPRGVT